MSEIAADEVEVIEDVTEEFPAPSLGAALEALLIVAVEPLSTVDLAEATRHPVDAVATRLAELAQEYLGQERGFALREVAGGWRFYTSASCSGLV
jgi:segregation and condensation protein B